MPRKIRILIVDDDPDLRTVLRLYLHEQYEVLCADSGLDAIAQLDGQPPDIFIVDAMMPKINGFLLIEILRAMKRFRHTPAIMLTGLDQKGDIREGYRKGATLYMFKPVEREHLLEVIRREIEMRKLNENDK